MHPLLLLLIAKIHTLLLGCHQELLLRLLTDEIILCHYEIQSDWLVVC